MFKININNDKKVQDILDSEQGKARQRLLTASDIQRAYAHASEKLDSLGIKKKNRIGCKVYLRPEKMPGNYNYPANGTFARIERFTTGWFLTLVNRTTVGSCSGGQSESMTLELTQKALEDIKFIEL